jgi:hypothetical protein
VLASRADCESSDLLVCKRLVPAVMTPQLENVQVAEVSNNPKDPISVLLTLIVKLQ